jgi:hypothetical protein
MLSRTIVAAILGAIPFVATPAWARTPLRPAPTALVEDVRSATANIEFMDYVGPGQVIKLQPQDLLVLSYLKSCEHETIVGGTVHVGSDRSSVEGGKIDRSTVPCDGGKMQLSSQEANASGASAFRLQSSPVDHTLYSLPPIIQLPKVMTADRTLIIARKDELGQRIKIKIDPGVPSGAFYDLADANVESLVPGATYSASIGGHKMTFKVDPNAKFGGAPLISRLLRFTRG